LKDFIVEQYDREGVERQPTGNWSNISIYRVFATWSNTVSTDKSLRHKKRDIPKDLAAVIDDIRS